MQFEGRWASLKQLSSRISQQVRIHGGGEDTVVPNPPELHGDHTHTHTHTHTRARARTHM